MEYIEYIQVRTHIWWILFLAGQYHCCIVAPTVLCCYAVLAGTSINRLETVYSKAYNFHTFNNPDLQNINYDSIIQKPTLLN